MRATKEQPQEREIYYTGLFLVKAMWKGIFTETIASLTKMECKDNHSKAPL